MRSFELPPPMTLAHAQRPTDRPGQDGHKLIVGLVVVTLAALGLRIWESWESSLWLDELHTLSHASLPSLAEVADSVRREFHTPLFFMGVHLFGGWEEGAWLRAIPVLSSLVVLWPLVSLARDVGGSTRAVLLAAWLWACLPYQVHWATELRPYAWLTLFSAAAVYLAFAERGSRVTRFVLFFACVLLGLFTHRIMALTVFSIGVARVLAPGSTSEHGKGRLGLGWLILAGTLGVAPFLPWMLGFASQATTDRFEYQEEVGGYTLRPQLVKEVLSLPMRVFVPYMGALGGVWSMLAKFGTLLLFGSFGIAAVLRLREGPAQGANPRLMRGLVVFVVADFLAVTALSIYTWDRVPLQYYAGLGWLLPVLAASLLARRKWLALTAAGAVLVLGVAQAGGSCTEDMRGAVRVVRELGSEFESAGRQPLYTALLSQPSEVFDHVLPYRAYARDLTALEPEDLPQPGEPGFERPVICLRRGAITYGNEKWEPITTGRRLVEEVHVDGYLTVFVLEPQ